MLSLLSVLYFSSVYASRDVKVPLIGPWEWCLLLSFHQSLYSFVETVVDSRLALDVHGAWLLCGFVTCICAWYILSFKAKVFSHNLRW